MNQDCCIPDQTNSCVLSTIRQPVRSPAVLAAEGLPKRDSDRELDLDGRLAFDLVDDNFCDRNLEASRLEETGSGLCLLRV